MPVPSYGIEERIAVLQVLDDGYLNEGPYVREFEKKFAEYVGAKHCILVPNGMLALWLALTTVKDEEITIPDYYSIFAANAILFAGKKPILKDETEGLKLPVHVNGRISNVSNAIIEDCCQAPFHHTKGLLSCYSFHSTKLLTCGGIGGAVCTDSDEQYLAMSAIKDHGRPERAQGKTVSSYHAIWGVNLKMPDICAAFGIKQLEKLPLRLQKVRDDYKKYREELGDSVEWLGEPSWRVDCLSDKEIGTPFYTPTHKQGIFDLPDERFPRTTMLCERGRYLT